jgi:predicted nucleotidyltransferase
MAVETVHQDNSLLERIFSSRVRIRLLSHFLLHPDARDHIRALANEVDAQYSAVWKELNNLEEAGLLQSEEVGGRRVFRLNTRAAIIPELRNILLKTTGVGDLIRRTFRDFEGVEAVFIFGSFAEGTIDAESDLDLMIIGDLEVAAVAPVIDNLEGEIARSVNYILLTRKEWNSRIEENDPLIANIKKEPKIMLIGTQDDI